MNQYNPDSVSPPCETVREILDRDGNTIDWLAHGMDWSIEEAGSFLANEVPITNAIAIKLGRLFVIDPAFWLRRQQYYRDHLTAQFNGSASSFDAHRNEPVEPHEVAVGFRPVPSDDNSLFVQAEVLNPSVDVMDMRENLRAEGYELRNPRRVEIDMYEDRNGNHRINVRGSGYEIHTNLHLTYRQGFSFAATVQCIANALRQLETLKGE